MNVTPEIILRADGATISHNGTGTLVVTIKGSNGAEEVVDVPPGAGITWFPPAGWTSATFSAPGHPSIDRNIV